MRSFAARLIVLTGGFVIMVIEIAGVLLLGPYFGRSHEVWVSQIGLVMVALATGYYLGGVLSDRWRRLALLVWLLLPAGVYVYFIPVFAPKALVWLVARHPLDQDISPLWLKLDPVIGSALIFLLPCLVLAILAPYFIGLSTRSLAHVGRESGLIFAFSTVGSIGGVFVCGFFLLNIGDFRPFFV